MFGTNNNSGNIGGSILSVLLNVFIVLFSWIVKIITSIISCICSGIVKLFNKRVATTNINNIYSISDKIKEAIKLNNQITLLTEKVVNLLVASSGDKSRYDTQLRYCKQLETQLTSSLNDINQDISNINTDTFVFRKQKYDHILSVIGKMSYSISLDELNEMLKCNSGWSKFINEVLEFAGVENIIKGDKEWKYTKSGINYHLSLDEITDVIKIKAKSVNPIKHLPSTKPMNKKIDEDAILLFDDSNELVLNLKRKAWEFDHYDAYEYFRTIENLLTKHEINEYAGKKNLSIREAFDVEDNVPLLLENIKKIAPPPADYLPDAQKMHGGKQRWAQLRDVERAGMLEGNGFLIGKMGYGSHLHTGQYGSHILTIASTGSGKGVGVVIPNLLRHKGSTVVLDPKGENYLVTAKQRAKLGNKVFYYDPWEIISDYTKRGGVDHSVGIKAKINPLDLINSNEVDIIDKAKILASSLIVRDSDKDSFFYNEAETFIARLIVYICTAYNKSDERRTLIELRRLLMIDKITLIREIIAYVKSNKNTTHRIVEHELLPWLDSNIQSGAKSLQSIYTFAQIGTSFLMSERVCDSLSSSNIDIMTLKVNPTSLFLVLDMDKLLYTSESYKPLVRLIITTCMMGASVREAAKDKLLFMLDEVAQLGYLQYLPNLLSIYRGKGVVIWTIWQNLSQIQQHYEKEWLSIIGNCDVQQYFGVNDQETAEYVSKYAGTTTIFEESINSSVTHNNSETYTEARGEQYSKGTSTSVGDNTGYSYQGFNYTSSGGTSKSSSTTENYTDSYNFSRSIQIGFSETSGKTLAKKAVPLITPFEVTTGNTYDVQFVFYMAKCPYPIISGKIKYYEDKAFYDEYSNNVTRI